MSIRLALGPVYDLEPIKEKVFRFLYPLSTLRKLIRKQVG